MQIYNIFHIHNIDKVSTKKFSLERNQFRKKSKTSNSMRSLKVLRYFLRQAMFFIRKPSAVFLSESRNSFLITELTHVIKSDFHLLLPL